MNTRSTRVLLIVLFLAGLLAYKNPTSAHFEEFASRYIAEKAADSNDDSAIALSANAAFGAISAKAVSSISNRADFIFFSSYTGEAFGYRWLVLGVAGNFFPLQVDEVKDDANGITEQFIPIPSK